MNKVIEINGVEYKIIENEKDAIDVEKLDGEVKLENVKKNKHIISVIVKYT